jgi:hypothetical protein
MLQQRPFARWFGALCLIWLTLNLPLLLNIRVLPWDAMISSYPTVYFNAHTLRIGQLPWWNPYIYSGFPQLADPQGLLFSPLLMAWMLLRKVPGASWFAWGVLLHVLMGGTAMLALLKRSGANAFGALLGATVFMAGGVAASRMEHTPILLAYAYAPLVLLLLRHFLQAPDWRRGLLLGVVAGAMVTQLVQLTYLMALMTVVYAASASAVHWRNYTTATRWRWLVGMLLAIACALAIGLPQLLFTWAFTTLSNRAVLPLAASANASLDWRTLLTLVDPNALHALRGPYSGPADHVEGYLYIGAIPILMLSGMGLAWREPTQRPQLMFFSAAALLAGLYMLGLNAPLYGWLYGWLPGMSYFRRPSDAAYVLNFSLAMISGLAASHFRLDARRRVATVLAVATVWLLLASLPMHRAEARWHGESLIAALIASLALWRLHRTGTRFRTVAWLMLLLVVDYRCFNLDGSFNEGPDKAKAFMHDATADFLTARMQPMAGAWPPRLEPIDAGTSWDNLVVLRELPSTQGYNPLRYGLYDRWYGARGNGGRFDGAPARVDTPLNAAPNSALSDLLGVRYLVKGKTTGAAAWSPPAGYEKIAANSRTGVEVWQNDKAYPHWLNPTRVIALHTQQVPLPKDFNATDFRSTLWLTPRDQQDQRANERLASTCSARLVASDVHAAPTQFSLHTQSAAAGWLVLSELDFPGWVADADGVNLPIHRANGMFRAVCVPAGDHTVHFVFHPWTMVAQVWRQRAR